MSTPLIILFGQTILLWLFVVILHRFKTRITLIPLYAYLALMTLLTHNLSDLGFSIVSGQWFFLISSFSFFTSLMLGVLFLYIFEGPRAGRMAIGVILSTSLLYILVVALLSLEVNTSKWIVLDWEKMTYYFWSIFAIILDVIFLAIVWELLSRIKRLPLLVRVFCIILGVLYLDTLVFTTGVFAGTDFYLDILRSNLVIRFFLSLFASSVITYFLKLEGYSEEKRQKPKKVWEILNFRSDLEAKISNLEEIIKQNKLLEDRLRSAEETYSLAIAGSGAGVWDWDVLTNKIVWSPKFCSLLGYEVGGIAGNLDAFKKILHPQDYDRTFDLVNKCFADGKPYEIEYRLKTKSGDYRWFLASGIIKYDDRGKPIRMVGSIIDIDAKKKSEIALQEKVEELTQLNDTMVGRELKMVEMKEELEKLKKK